MLRMDTTCQCISSMLFNAAVQNVQQQVLLKNIAVMLNDVAAVGK